MVTNHVCVQLLLFIIICILWSASVSLLQMFKKEMYQLRKLVEAMPFRLKEEIDIARNTVTEIGTSKMSDMSGKSDG